EQKEQMQKMQDFVPVLDRPPQEMARMQSTVATRQENFQASSEMQPEIPVEEQPITPSPAVIIKPPVLFRKPTPTTKASTSVAPKAPAVRPPVPATKAPLSIARPPAPPTQPNTPVPISTEAAAPVSAPMVKSSLAMNQERWDEDSFHGLWDTSEDKGMKSEYDFAKSELSPSPTSLASGMPQLSKPPVVHQTVDYGHGHNHGQDITTSKGGQIPYGERITLHPEPPHERQSFSKELEKTQEADEASNPKMATAADDRETAMRYVTKEDLFELKFEITKSIRETLEEKLDLINTKLSELTNDVKEASKSAEMAMAVGETLQEEYHQLHHIVNANDLKASLDIPLTCFEKLIKENGNEHPGQRDRYIKDRESYFERQNNTNTDHRDLRREREPYRDRGSGDHERERFDKDRYPREDRPSPSRTQSYRDKDHSNSRRGGFERQSYERKQDRPPYDHGPSVFGGDRRNYPEERMSIPAPSIPRQPPPAPRVEKKPESKNVDDILKPPGRESRPERIVIIMRGLPGSGKTHVAKLIRDKEVECGGAAPRVLSLDDYFITEIEKEERDPDTKKRVKKKVLEYEYEADMEEVYRASMFKTFKKTLDDGFFPFIILDAINDKVRHFEQFWSAAKTKGFEVYVAEITADNQTCCKRNVHGRKLKEINRMADYWEMAPRHMIRLDIRSLLQDAAIEEVEMEDFDANIEDQKEDKKDPDEEESELVFVVCGRVEINLKFM
ncbi:UNVERIFIED_CONTAM: hypothetical protein K2H54_000533, partial [Gekko kuhli]